MLVICYLKAFSINLILCRISFGNSSDSLLSLDFLLESNESLRVIFVVKGFMVFIISLSIMPFNIFIYCVLRFDIHLCYLANPLRCVRITSNMNQSRVVFVSKNFISRICTNYALKFYFEQLILACFFYCFFKLIFFILLFEVVCYFLNPLHIINPSKTYYISRFNIIIILILEIHRNSKYINLQ